VANEENKPVPETPGVNKPGLEKPVLGIVGGIGSGKSLVAELLVQRGGWLINADALGHEALTAPDIKRQVVARFGADILDEQGAIVRKRLGKKVFTDRAELRALEAIVFPFIKRRIVEEMDRGRREPTGKFIVLDAAVLFEAGWSQACDKVIFVDAPRELRLARLKERRGWEETQLAAREAAQMALEEKKRRADAVLYNSGTVEVLGGQVDGLLARWNMK
jgi:dephospho-CoA kinase